MFISVPPLSVMASATNEPGTAPRAASALMPNKPLLTTILPVKLLLFALKVSAPLAPPLVSVPEPATAGGGVSARGFVGRPPQVVGVLLSPPPVGGGGARFFPPPLRPAPLLLGRLGFPRPPPRSNVAVPLAGFIPTLPVPAPSGITLAAPSL